MKTKTRTTFAAEAAARHKAEASLAAVESAAKSAAEAAGVAIAGAVAREEAATAKLAMAEAAAAEAARADDGRRRELESSLAAGSWGHEFWCSALPIAAELIAVRQSAAEYK